MLLRKWKGRQAEIPSILVTCIYRLTVQYTDENKLEEKGKKKVSPLVLQLTNYTEWQSPKRGGGLGWVVGETHDLHPGDQGVCRMWNQTLLIFC